MPPTLRALIALSVIALWTCTDATSVSETADPWGLGAFEPSPALVEQRPAVCATSTLTPLIADEVVPVGTVEVTQGDAHIYVTYETDEAWPISKTAVFVGASAAELPLSGGGNPQVGRFPYKAVHDGLFAVIWEIPIGSLAGDDVIVAAFAEVGSDNEGAWPEGTAISAGGNWAMYLTHAVAACAARTIDGEGGTVATSDGGARLVIPAGALAEPVDITIDPASVEDILEHVEGSDGAFPTGPALVTPLPSIDDVTPIEGTLWDFGPDGQEFAAPVTVTLSYDPADLPDGVPEEQLGIFVINGIWVAPPSEVDLVAKTVTAQIEHFSFAFVGYQPPVEADLTVSSLSLSASSEARVGARMDFMSNVRNLGPDASGGGTLTYQAFGDVLLGDVFGSCVEIPNPIFGAVAISCDVAALAADAIDGIESFQLIPQSSGDVEVWATVNPATGETDPVGENDRRTLVVSVDASTADVRITRFEDNPDPVEAGGLVVYDIYVTSETTVVDNAELHVIFTGDWIFEGSTLVDCLPISNRIECTGLSVLPGGTVWHQVQVRLPTAGQMVTAEARVQNHGSPSVFTTTTVEPAGGGSF